MGSLSIPATTPRWFWRWWKESESNPKTTSTPAGGRSKRRFITGQTFAGLLRLLRTPKQGCEMKLSVLMSVYAKEYPAFFRVSLESLAAQTLPADEIVIVEDGPLGEELKAVIEVYKSCLPIVSLRLPVNVGLGAALREGLNVCQGEYVARMDSDDICVPERFF